MGWASACVGRIAQRQRRKYLHHAMSQLGLWSWQPLCASIVKQHMSRDDSVDVVHNLLLAHWA